MNSETSAYSRVRVNLLLLSYVSFVALGLSVGLLGVAWPTMRADFSLPLDAVGFLFISTTIGYLLSSFFIGRLINHFGIGLLLFFSSLISVASLFGYTIAPSWSIIIILGCIGGLGSGAIDAGLNTYLAAEYNESQMQWLHASFGIGATLSPILMTISLAQFGSWRLGYLIVGSLMILMAASFYFTMSAWKQPKAISNKEEETQDHPRGLMDYETPLWKTLLLPVTWASIFMFLLYTGAELTLGNWTYTLLTEGRGISPQMAGLWAGGFWATFTLGRVLAGLYAHRINLNMLMLGELGLAFIGAILFWWNPQPIASLVGVFLAGFGLAPIFPGLVSSTSQRVGPQHAANTIGIQVSAAGLGGAVLPSLAGALAQRISLETIPIMLSVSLLALLALYLLSITFRGSLTR